MKKLLIVLAVLLSACGAQDPADTAVCKRLEQNFWRCYDATTGVTCWGSPNGVSCLKLVEAER